MNDDLLRVYFDPAEIGLDGYPYAWHKIPDPGLVESGDPRAIRLGLKDLVRMQAGNRCERCGHPYVKGQGLNGGWSRCDGLCTHGGPTRGVGEERGEWDGFEIEAQWRILTVHHLNGVKYDCRWWNLAALCQRCHLTIQGKVYMDRPWHKPHTEWFKPHAAGYYASAFLGEELDREQTLARLDELLDLQLRQNSLF